MTQDPTLERTMHLVFELSRILHQAMTQKMKDGPISHMQVHMMFYIQSHEGITMKELAQYLKITSPSATSFVERLVKLGLLKRTQDPKNRKLVRIGLTPDGQKLINEKLKSRQQVIASIFSLLPTEDQTQLNRIFDHLLTSYNRSHS